MTQPNYPQPGGPASMRSLERAFGKKFTLEDEEEKAFRPHPPKDQQREALGPKAKAWDDLKLPQYPEDFDHVFFQIDFTGFLHDLEKLHGGLALPLPVAAIMWTKLITKKHEEWIAVNISSAEKADMLVKAIDSANRENYEAYRMINDEIEDKLESGKPAGTSESRQARKARKKGERQSRKLSRKETRKERKKGADFMMSNTLTRPMAVKKERTKKHSPRYKEVMKGPIASRLRSRVEAPDLPSLEENDAGVPVPELGREVKMEF